MSTDPRSDPQTISPPTGINWKRLHALGLPAGSVRALLAILVFGTALGLLAFVPNQELPDYLREFLFIILGHYFASRKRVGQVPEAGPPPLYLPNGSVRLVLIAGCVGVAALLYQRGQLTNPGQNPGAVTLWLIGGFLLGVALSSVSGWLVGKNGHPPRILEDGRALISIAAAIVLVALVWNRFLRVVSPERIDATLGAWFSFGRFRLEHILAAVVGFYFGSRS
jgi:hypothetical protein